MFFHQIRIFAGQRMRAYGPCTAPVWRCLVSRDSRTASGSLIPHPPAPGTRTGTRTGFKQYYLRLSIIMLEASARYGVRAIDKIAYKLVPKRASASCRDIEKDIGGTRGEYDMA